jgi:replication factor A1
MLATQLNHFVHSGQIQENTLIQITDYMNNTVQGRVVIIVLNLVVVGNHPERIGSPMDIGKTSNSVGTAEIHTTNTTTNTTQPMYSRTNATDTITSTNPTNISSTLLPSASVNPYGGPKPAMMVPTAPIVRSTANVGVPLTPISQLNMYQNRWTIQARVTTKSDIRSWSNARGEGTLFSIELLDSSAVDVKATFFKEAVDKFYGMLEVNSVYTFSGGRLKVANTQYNACKCPYEITFDQNSEIHKVNDTGDIQSQRYDFVSIASLETAEAGTTVDILVYIKSIGEPTPLISKKSGQELIKCDLLVFDQSATEISLTVWGDQARQAPSLYANPTNSLLPIMVAFRRVRISDYNGKSLSTTTSGCATILSTPSLPEATALQRWWQQQQQQMNHGSVSTMRSLSANSAAGNASANINLTDRKDIRAIQMEHLGLDSDKADWISFAGTVTFIKKDKEGGAWYPACANAGEPCKNRFKVTQTTDNNWFCDKCQGTYPNCVRRWIFSATISDDTSTTWVSFFNEQAEILLGTTTADEVYGQVFDTTNSGGTIQQQDLYDSYFTKVLHTDWIFKCKVKQEMMGDEARVKTNVHSLQPINYAKECADLLDAIAKL